MSNPEYSAEEKNVFLLMSEKFLNRLSLLNWYILTEFNKDENFSELVSATRQVLSRYMDKSRVADYISTMVMELALNNENANIKKEAQAKPPLRPEAEACARAILERTDSDTRFIETLCKDHIDLLAVQVSQSLEKRMSRSSYIECIAVFIELCMCKKYLVAELFVKRLNLHAGENADTRKRIGLEKFLFPVDER